MKFCTECGQQLNEDSKFCNKCGAPAAALAAGGIEEIQEASIPEPPQVVVAETELESTGKKAGMSPWKAMIYAILVFGVLLAVETILVDADLFTYENIGYPIVLYLGGLIFFAVISFKHYNWMKQNPGRMKAVSFITYFLIIFFSYFVLSTFISIVSY